MVNSSSVFMAEYTTFDGTLHYPLSFLDNQSFSKSHLNSLMELVIDDYGNSSYVNKKTEISTFYDFLISSHPIFNKIDDVYNDHSVPEINEYTNQITYRYASNIYISGQTYFKTNPYTFDTKAFKDNNLLANQTIQKRQIEQFIHDNALEINPIHHEDTMVQYEEYGWNKSATDSENPRIDILSFVKLSTPSDDCRIKRGILADNIPLYHSNAIRVFSNAFVTIVGKVLLPSDFVISQKRMPYYTPEKNLWVGVWWNNSIVAISELHNIKNVPGVGYVAYYSIQMPMAMYERYYIVVPFKPNKFGSKQSSDSSDENDMFANIPMNCFSIFYYSKTQEESAEPETLFN